MKNNCVEGRSEFNKLNEFSDYLKIIADINRLKILCLLKKGERCVCNINEPLGLRQNLTSHHLKALRDAGLVLTRRDGKWVHYRINTEKLNYLNELYNEIISRQ
ncbi:MAG: winged helix-turn-helix transcriptional regulator [Thermoleophilia bacterium]|nr:winged helix-turn-helix transcriptional regulator [Thermoleophilia bacterium]